MTVQVRRAAPASMKSYFFAEEDPPLRSETDTRVANVATLAVLDTLEIDWDNPLVDLQVRAALGEQAPRAYSPSRDYLNERFNNAKIPERRLSIYRFVTVESLLRLRYDLHIDEQEARLQGRNRRATPEQAAYVWVRELGQCGYCNVGLDTRYKTPTADHVVPWSDGGRTLVDNLKCSCYKCNIAKYTMAADEFMDRISGSRGRQERDKLFDQNAWRFSRR